VATAYATGAAASTAARELREVLNPEKVRGDDLHAGHAPVPPTKRLKLHLELLEPTTSRRHLQLQAGTTIDPPVPKSLRPASIRAERTSSHGILQVLTARQAMTRQTRERVRHTVLPKPAGQPLKRVDNLSFAQ
jgi:hypothetical protein